MNNTTNSNNEKKESLQETREKNIARNENFLKTIGLLTDSNTTSNNLTIT